MRRSLALAALAALAGCAQRASGQAGRSVRFDLVDASGATVARAELTARSDGVLVHVEAFGVPPGSHGLHVHETGRCRPDFEAAGAHYNPGGTEHGLRHERGPHAGDLPDLFVPVSGRAVYERLAPALALDGLLSGDGSALVIHAWPDDGLSQPAGRSGPRIACGVLEAD